MALSGGAGDRAGAASGRTVDARRRRRFGRGVDRSRRANSNLFVQLVPFLRAMPLHEPSRYTQTRNGPGRSSASAVPASIRRGSALACTRRVRVGRSGTESTLFIIVYTHTRLTPRQPGIDVSDKHSIQAGAGNATTSPPDPTDPNNSVHRAAMRLTYDACACSVRVLYQRFDQVST